MSIHNRHYDELLEDGFTIIPEFYSGAHLRELQAAQRRVIKTWDQVKHDPPADRTMMVPQPAAEMALNREMVNEDLLALGKRFYNTDDVHIRVGVLLARYPGFRGDHSVHIDNGNNSLLPPSETDRTFAQLTFWTHLEEVGPDQAPLQLIPNRYGQDLSKATQLVCPAGTVAIFSTYTWHSAGDYTRADGQRFTCGFGLGRGDHPWEGFRHYTHMGCERHFQQFISTLTARQRQYFRFPPPGHRYYTKQTLEALERQYPGWNARGEYTAAAPR